MSVRHDPRPDPKTERRVSTWLADTDLTPLEAGSGLERLIDAFPSTPQVRRRHLGRRLERAGGARRGTRRLDPATVTDRRKRLMFSFVGLTAALAVLAVGITQFGTGDQVSQPATGAVDAASPSPSVSPSRSGDRPAAEFTARWLFSGAFQPYADTGLAVNGVSETRGERYAVEVISSSDPRLDGDVTSHQNNDAYLGTQLGDPVFTVRTMDYRIETAEGAWRGLPEATISLDRGIADHTIVLIGEGAYDGLTAVALLDVDPDAETFGDPSLGWGADVRGYIFQGDVPPPPQR